MTEDEFITECDNRDRRIAVLTRESDALKAERDALAKLVGCATEYWAGDVHVRYRSPGVWSVIIHGKSHTHFAGTASEALDKGREIAKGET